MIAGNIMSWNRKLLHYRQARIHNFLVFKLIHRYVACMHHTFDFHWQIVDTLNSFLGSIQMISVSKVGVCNLDKVKMLLLLFFCVAVDTGDAKNTNQ